jgi:hypothetical protein
MIKTYKFAITGADATDIVHFLGFADTLEEAKTLKAKAQETGYRQVAVIDAIGLVQSV